MNWTPNEIAPDEGPHEQFCGECECVSSVLVKVVVKRYTRTINEVATVEELWCPDCVQNEM